MEQTKQIYPMEIGDYLGILKRRKTRFFVAFFLIFVSGVIIALVLPPVYYSESTILIERQEIPTDMVATTVTGYVQERIEGIKQRLVSRSNLQEIADKFDLYPELRASGDTTEFFRSIRQSISVNMLDIKGTDPNKGRQGEVTVAFSVGYESDDPVTAQKVATELTERYLAANKAARVEQAAEVSKFLDEEAEKIRLEMVELEKSLASFKQEQREQLPELMDMNLRLYEKTENQIAESKDRILKLEDTINSVSAELALTDPRKDVRTDEGKLIQSPSERLSALIAEYLQASSRYTPSHPDVIRLRREIKTLGGQTKKATQVNSLVDKLTVLRGQLLDATQKYTSAHPDVKKLEKSISRVEKGLRDVVVVETRRGGSVPANNPRYVSLKTQLDAAYSNMKEEKSKLATYESKLQEYEQRLFQTPIVERDYQSLTRDYSNAKAKYNELRAKQSEARLAQQLEVGEQGERFTLASAAYLPTTPDKPNRLGIILLSGLLAFSAGIGMVAKAEYMDRSVRGKRGVVEVFGALPIVIVPYIENSVDESENRARRKRMIMIVTTITVLVLIILQYLYLSLGDT